MTENQTTLMLKPGIIFEMKNVSKKISKRQVRHSLWLVIFSENLDEF
jgi:hypothetical protein